jgi:predicted dehydrogenase
VDQVYVAGRNLEGINILKTKIKELKQRVSVEIPIKYLPENKDDCKCYKEAIRRIPKPACAIVVVPDHLHREVAGYAIGRGLHTLVVKPLAPTLKEARELIELQKLNKVYCAVEFHKRFDHANLKLKDTIAQGLIGDPLYFLVEYSQRKSVPSERFLGWTEETNVFQYLGIHYVDIIFFATKAKPKRAMAIAQKGWLASKGINSYDSIQGVIEWEMPSGKRFSSHIFTNWIDPEKTSAMSDQKIKVIGTKGRFESDQKKRGVTVITDNNGIEESNPYFCSAYGTNGEVFYYGYGIDSIHQFLKDVVYIEGGVLKIDDLENQRPTFKQSVIPTAVLEKINESLVKNGEWLDIEI